MAGVKISELTQATGAENNDTIAIVRSGTTRKQSIGEYVKYTGEFYQTSSTVSIPQNPTFVGLPSMTQTVKAGSSLFTTSVETVNGVNTLTFTSTEDQICLVSLRLALKSGSISDRTLYFSEVIDEGGGWKIPDAGSHIDLMSDNETKRVAHISIARKLDKDWKYTWMFSSDDDDFTLEPLSYTDPLGASTSVESIYIEFGRYAPPA